MSEHKKTFNEWWAGLHQETRDRDHVVKGILEQEGFRQVSRSADGLATEWQRSAGRVHNLPEPDLMVLPLSREAQAWLLCHLIAEVSKLNVERARNPSTFREAALADDARLAMEILQALNDARALNQ